MAAGGLGILAGDSALSYGSERALETYYSFQIWKTIYATVDYQFEATRHLTAIAGRCQSSAEDSTGNCNE
jgi:hypothetical protein